jgi:membrane associated rhomboid family serine protease
MILAVIIGPILSYKRKAMFVMVLVIFNFVIFFIMFFGVQTGAVSIWEIYENFAFSSNYLIGKGSAIAPFSSWKVLTIFSHMFIHSYFTFLHIIMNMVFLLFLGIPFEEKVGPWVFIAVYFIAGVCGSLFTALFDFAGGGAFGGNPAGIGVGASGAIFGVLGAFVALYPKEKIMFPLIIIRKWPVWVIAGIYFGIETMVTLSGQQDGIGHFAHIGGFLGGLLCVPLLKKIQVTHQETRALDTLDFDSLEQFATDYKLKDMLEKIKKEDEPEIRETWLQEFLKNISCPECGKKLTVKGHTAKCTCGFKIKY